jgi:hypothetical protein
MFVTLHGLSVEDSNSQLRYLYLFLSRSTKFTKFKIATELKKHRQFFEEDISGNSKTEIMAINVHAIGK